MTRRREELGGCDPTYLIGHSRPQPPLHLPQSYESTSGLRRRFVFAAHKHDCRSFGEILNSPIVGAIVVILQGLLDTVLRRRSHLAQRHQSLPYTKATPDSPEHAKPDRSLVRLQTTQKRPRQDDRCQVRSLFVMLFLPRQHEVASLFPLPVTATVTVMVR